MAGENEFNTAKMVQEIHLSPYPHERCSGADRIRKVVQNTPERKRSVEH
jgi:hypothetical protein